MANSKDDREESDGDEMEHESGESEKSSSTSDSSDGSDTDDSSELDVEECERRRNECLDNLADMERQFAVLREQLYRERITQIKQKLEEVHEGVAQEYLQPLKELQESMQVRIEVAGVLRKLCLENIENSFQAEEQAAWQNYENEKILLFDFMKEELEEKIRKLEEDRNSVDFHSDSFFHSEKVKGSHSSAKGRGTWRKGHKPESGKRKPVSVTGPYIVYMLSDAEILEDWTAIKKSLTSKRNAERKPTYHRYT